MISSFNGIFTIVKNRGKPFFWCGKFEKKEQEFMNFETRDTGIASSFLLILEKKL